MKLAYIDSSVWIARVEGLPEYRNILDKALSELLQNEWQFCISDIVLLEILAKPYKQNNSELISIYRKIFEKTKLLGVPANLFVNALLIVQSEQLNAMDALHIALALHHRCQYFVSTDKHFRNLKLMSTIWIDLQSI